MKNEFHSFFLVDQLSTAADIFDFAEYYHDKEVSHMVGLDLIWC